jgi:hypothetical protein
MAVVQVLACDSRIAPEVIAVISGVLNFNASFKKCVILLLRKGVL